ncbi:hypothetical protein [Streptomyces bacillaris]|uniref:hypothetical protein n=1 Tax=Streptomyces bacillaris TaxID=68179 RepID=UPI00345FA8AB
MTFADDLRTLLTDELDDSNAESELYAALIRTPLLLEFVGGLIAVRDVTALRALCHDTVELHELTDRYGIVPGALPTPDEPPFSGCGPVTGAVRAVAALGLVLADEEEPLGDHLRTALTWLAHTRATAAAPWPDGRAAPDCPYAGRMSAVVRALGADPHGTAVVVWLLALQGVKAKEGAAATVDVLLDRGDRGIRATLRCTTLRKLPPALVPDPRDMLLFTADARFRSGLETAWQTTGTSRRGTVLWSLKDADGPVDHVQDISLTAAFTVLVDEVRRLGRRVRGPFTLRRVGGAKAVVGGVDEEGRTVSVSGYRNKFAAAAGLDRIVVPADDLEQAREHGRVLQTTVVGVRTWRAAARRVRIPDRRAQRRLLVVCVVLLLTASGIGGYFWERQQELQQLRDTAAAVRDRAYENNANGDPGLGLLLAMASDDIAGRAGKRTGVLDTLARNNSSLRRILRPAEGTYAHLALSRNGAWGGLSTTTGAVEILSTTTGETVWSQKGSGVELPVRGVHISDLAVSRRGQRAAFASTDLRLTVLENREGTWSVVARPGLPVPSLTGPRNSERNAVDHLEFTADGQRIVAYVGPVGLFVFDAKRPDAPPRRCPESGSAQAMSATKGEALLTKDREVVRIDLTTCARSVVLTAPDDVRLHGAVGDHGVVAVATRDAQVLVLRPGRSETLISDRGPYQNASITMAEDGAQLTAESDHGTFGWNVTGRTQRFGYPKGGPAVMSNGIVLRHHGVVAELYDDQRSPATTAWGDFFGGLASVSWARDVLVIGGGRNVYAMPHAAGLKPGTFSDPANHHRLLHLPAGARTHVLATSRGGPWAAALYTETGGKHRRPAVWDVVERRRTPVRLPKEVGLRHVSFVGHDLYFGYNTGEVRRFRFADGEWRSAGSHRLPESVVALGGGTGDRLYAVMSKGGGARPTVVAMRASDLTVTASRRLEGTTATAKVEVMRDGQVVTGTGAGVVTFFTAELDLRGRFVDGALRYLFDLTEIPDRGHVLVSGENRSIVLDRRTLAPQEAWKQGAPFLSADVPKTEDVMATYSFAKFTVALWALKESDLRQRVCRAVGRELSREEWRRHIGGGVPYEPVCAA